MSESSKSLYTLRRELLRESVRSQQMRMALEQYADRDMWEESQLFGRYNVFVVGEDGWELARRTLERVGE